MDLSDIEISFDYGGDSESERREIVRNVQTIMTTPIGTCPLYRDFGLDVSALDYPLDIAQSLIAVAAIEAIEKWEPRVTVKDLTFQPDTSGQLKAKVVISSG